jgi:hypothetical protein
MVTASQMNSHHPSTPPIPLTHKSQLHSITAGMGCTGTCNRGITSSLEGPGRPSTVLCKVQASKPSPQGSTLSAPDHTYSFPPCCLLYSTDFTITCFLQLVKYTNVLSPQDCTPLLCLALSSLPSSPNSSTFVFRLTITPPPLKLY